ncbi:hypothetical protein C8Q75DRAFT_771440 [Abortiporus biennis]|nr:hypothetical protein C8Q75DRAFT_771440 [Abortiporus biennis]
MSTIHFNNPVPGSLPSTSSPNELYFSSSFDTPNASFQMNPLSSHPPRTSRDSIGSTSQLYGTDLYTTQADTQEAHLELDDVSEIGDEKTTADARSRVRKTEILKELLLTATGRDKVFKLMQYSLRMYLLFHSSVTATAAFKGTPRHSWETALVKRFSSTIGHLSMTRKCLILFNWLGPLNSILAQNSSDPFPATSNNTGKTKNKPLLHTVLHTSPPVLLDLINAAADDIYTFSRLGLIGKRTGERAGDFADWCWFIGTLVNLVENSVERGVIMDLQHQVESRLYAESMTGATTKSNPTANQVDHKELERLQRQDYWIQVSRLKLVMDLVYVSYNVFHLKKAKGPVQTLTGLAAAALSTAKMYDRHKTSLVKALKFEREH